MLGSSIKTAVSWAKVSCNTSSSFSPSASAFSAVFPFPVLFCAVDKAGIPSFLSLSFCKNFTSSNANLQTHQINQRPKLSNYPSSQLKKTHTTETNKSPKNKILNSELTFVSLLLLSSLLYFAHLLLPPPLTDVSWNFSSAASQRVSASSNLIALRADRDSEISIQPTKKTLLQALYWFL